MPKRLVVFTVETDEHNCIHLVDHLIRSMQYETRIYEDRSRRQLRHTRQRRGITTYPLHRRHERHKCSSPDPLDADLSPFPPFRHLCMCHSGVGGLGASWVSPRCRLTM